MQIPLRFDYPEFRVAVLGSGSSGNSVVIESGRDRLMIDAGFSCRQLEKRMAAIGLEPERFQGLLLTHEHGDHVRGAKRFVKRHSVPIYATEGTLDGLPLEGATTIRSGRPFELASFRVEPFGVPHDAREPVGFVVEDRYGRRVGVVGDLGMRSRLAWAHLKELDVLVLETNHDLEMLRTGPYPWPLKQRVAGRHGHLSNEDAVTGLAEVVGDRLRWVVLYHLSRTNNSAALAGSLVGEELVRQGCPAEICVSAQHEPTPWLRA